MYLSRVEIDQGNRQKLKDLTHLGAYHSWVENSFPEKFGQDRPRHLWRIDTLRHKRYLLVVSAEKPNLNLLDKYGVPGTAETKNYDPFLEKVKQNMIYNFRLTANPVHRVTQPGQKNGKLYPHITIEKQKEWLINRAKNCGFEIIKDESGIYQFDVVSRDWPLLFHKGTKRVRLSRVNFEGQLKVVDLKLFKQHLISGIGKEKAYGMGMLTIIPVRA